MATAGVKQKSLLDVEIERYEAYPKDQAEFYLSILRADNRQERLDALTEEQRFAALQYERLVVQIERLVRERLRIAQFAKAPSEPNLGPILTFQGPQVVIENLDSDGSEKDQTARRQLFRRNTQ